MNQTIPAVQQNIKVRTDIDRVKPQDSIRFGMYLARVLKVLSTNPASTTPHFLVEVGRGARARQYQVFRNQIKGVIFKSTDEYEDLGEPDFSVLKSA